MKMPATTATKVEAKSPTELGDAAKQCLNCLEKKVRNLEKRKVKIEVNREKADKGTKLEKEQEISLKQYDQVTHDLEFARELHKQFQTIYSEHEKMVKKQAKREKAERQAVEIKRVSEILQLQSTLDLLGGDKVREDFKTGKHGAVVLTEDNLEQLDQLYQAISPSRDDSGDEYPQKLTAAADHLVNVLDGKDRQVMGTTYKELKELLALINGCGYFENAVQQSGVEEAEADEAEEEEGEEAVAETGLEEPTETLSLEAEDDDQAESLDQIQQPVDLSTATTPATTEGVKSHLDMPTQPMNTMEQDAFFAPSSTYQSENQTFSSQQQQQQGSSQQQAVTDFQSFTDNRPFQFIQASYIMSDGQQAPSVVDPAVIHAQPAGASSLQFMQSGFESSSSPSPAQQSSQQAAQPQPPSQAGLVLGHQSSLPSNTSSNAQMVPPQAPQEFSTSQSFGQPALQQNLQTEGLFHTGGVEEVTSSNPLSSHSALMGQMREEAGSGAPASSSSHYDIPPSIPMPPSQDQSPLEQQQQQQQQQQLEEKKFQMNASAPVFQSMYDQVATGAVPVSVPPPSVSADTPSTADFNAQNANSDFQQSYQGNNGFNNYSRSGGRSNYRGSRNGAGGPPGGPNSALRNGSSAVQNGFGGGRSAGPMANRGGGRGGYGYSSNPYRQQDNYQNAYNTGGFGSYQKRGGMSNPGGPPNMGNPGYNSRGGSGGMRGGMPRGGQRGMRGGFSRPPPQ